MTVGNGSGSTVPARRDRSAAGRRPAGVLIRLTEQERGALTLRAEALGITVQRYLLECAAAVEAGDSVLETRTQHDEFIKDLMSVRRLLANVANNVNQIAKVANSGGLLGFEAQANASFAAAGRASDRIYDLINQVLPRRRVSN